MPWQTVKQIGEPDNPWFDKSDNNILLFIVIIPSVSRLIFFFFFFKILCIGFLYLFRFDGLVSSKFEIQDLVRYPAIEVSALLTSQSRMKICVVFGGGY